jgi:hypothetical protein
MGRTTGVSCQRVEDQSCLGNQCCYCELKLEVSSRWLFQSYCEERVDIWVDWSRREILSRQIRNSVGYVH